MSPGRALVPVELDPYNAETPMGALAGPVTPTDLVYLRNHFAVPDVAAERWRLTVGGAVDRPITLSLPDLERMDDQTVTMVLECAGNGRDTMEPRPPGTPWRVGAASTTSFTGMPLAGVLAAARPGPGAVEVLFRGADGGEVAPGRAEHHERSLPLDAATGPGPILTWAMGGEPLTAEHGAPLRLVVPGRYGMASVKWLTHIEAMTEPFRGFYQYERYIYVGEDGIADGTPVSAIRVRSLIARPADGDTLAPGPFVVAGTAWSGEAPIVRVQVTADGGSAWADAEIGEPAGPQGAVAWRFTWDAEAGPNVLAARATDAAGATQPLEPVWNRWGYGNNVVHRVPVTVASSA